MFRHLCDIGFNFDNSETFCDEFIKMIEDNVNKSSQVVAVDDKAYLVVYVDTDIEFWLPIEGEKTLNPYNFEIHYNTHRWDCVSNPRWVSKTPDNMQGLCNVYLGNESTFTLNANIPNATACPNFVDDLTYKCQLACFVDKIKIYSTTNDFKKEFEQINEESFIPMGMFNFDNEENPQESSHAWINGKIKSFELKTNTYTNKKFYIVRLACFGETFDLLVDEKAIDSTMKIGDIVSAVVWISAKIRPTYTGHEIGNTPRLVKGKSSIETLDDLYNVLVKSWNKQTAYPSCQKDWNKEDPSYGQCAITAMLVNAMFGGTIHKIRVDGGGTHYFNKINDTCVDLTREQFDLYNICLDYTNNQQIDKQYCGKNPDTKKRYELLIESVIKNLNN